MTAPSTGRPAPSAVGGVVPGPRAAADDAAGAAGTRRLDGLHVDPSSSASAGPQSGGRRAALLIGAVVLLGIVALPASHAAMLAQWRYATPEAEVAVVPLLTVLLLAVGVRRQPWLFDLPRSARVDLAVTAVLVSAAAALLWVLPTAWPGGFWSARCDLVAFPLLVTAAITAVAGIRSLLVLKGVVTFAWAAWTLPWAVLMQWVSPAVTGATSAVLARLVTWTHLAAVVPGSAGDLMLRVPATDDGFLVSVASACSGAGSMLAFVLVGLATTVTLRPARPDVRPLRRRVAWLAAGLAACWLANLVRLVLLAWTGGRFGRDVALGVLHPMAGLLLSSAVFGLALLAVPLFGLRLGIAARRPVDSPLMRPHARPVPLRRRAVVALTVTVGLGLAAVVPGNLHAFAEARPAPAAVVAPLSFGEAMLAHPEWHGATVAQMPWAQPYFGPDSDWTRYRLHADGSAGGTGFTVWADSISTSSLTALTARTVQDCYRLHDFQLDTDRSVEVAAGVPAHAVVYTRPDGERWNAVTWEWTVGERARRYERVTLLASFAAGQASSSSSQDVLGVLLTTARQVAATRLGRPSTTQDVQQAPQALHAREARS